MVQARVRSIVFLISTFVPEIYLKRVTWVIYDLIRLVFWVTYKFSKLVKRVTLVDHLHVFSTDNQYWLVLFHGAMAAQPKEIPVSMQTLLITLTGFGTKSIIRHLQRQPQRPTHSQVSRTIQLVSKIYPKRSLKASNVQSLSNVTILSMMLIESLVAQLPSKETGRFLSLPTVAGPLASSGGASVIFTILK